METWLIRSVKHAAIAFALVGITATMINGAGHAQTILTHAHAFTADQAARGKAAFADNCASCHGGKLDDGEFGPALKGAAFQSRWAGQAPEALLDYVRTRMPPSGPGTLPEPTYAAIEAYILQANGVAGGIVVGGRADGAGLGRAAHDRS